MIEQMTDELDTDELLRHRALEMAMEYFKDSVFTSDMIIEAANKFYNFLKGIGNENVQTANH